MSIRQQLNDKNIFLNDYSIGKHQTTCPFCSKDRKKKHNKVFAVWIENGIATYNCIHCGEHGFVVEKEFIKKTYTLPNVAVKDNLGEKAKEFFNNRGLSVENAKKLGIYIEGKKFSKPMIAFPYFKNGLIVNVKYRGILEKSFTQEVNGEPVFYNYDNCFGKKEIIIVEGECLAGDTEILTPKGWLKLTDYQNEDVLQIDYKNNFNANFIKPKAYIKKIFNGNLKYRTTGGNYSIVCTPEHGMIAIERNGEVTKKEFNKLSTADRIPLNCFLNGNGIDLKDDEIKLLIAISADGTLRKRVNGNTYIDIAFKKERKINRLKEILNNLNIDYKISIQKSNIAMTHFYFEYNNAFKEFPIEWIEKSTLNQKKLIIDEILQWDGNSVPNRKQIEYSTKLKHNADFIQTIAHCCGLTSTIINRQNELGKWFKISILFSKNIVSMQGGIVTDILHNDYVYCVQVDTGAILIRHNNKISITGNCDVLAMMEAGFENVVSVPAGSIGKEVDKNEDGKKFDFIKNSQPLIDSCDKFILALDNDEAGQCMTKALIDRLGRGKCKLVDWGLYETPTPCKDANDFLKVDKDIIVDAISIAKPLPLRGVVRCNDDMEEFEEYLKYGTQNAISTGFENLDKYIKFELGNFITITGYPGSGKSQFMTNLILNLAKNYEFKTLFCAFENSVKQLKKKWCQMLIGCPTINANDELIEELRTKTYGFMNEYFYPLQDFTNNLNIDNILEIAEESIQMYGIKCVVIDPFNKIGYTKTNNITEDIGSVLNKITAFAKKNNVLVFLVAHPTKPSERKINKAEVPSGFDIAGSANFLNMSDVVLTVYRNQDEEANKSKECKVMVSKVRDNDYGQEGSAYFRYNTYSGIYQEIEKTQFKEKKHNEDF